ncbi:MAG TPA: ATP-binding cassette domain-containing protein [Longimicrobiaceae bacterium]|nr:ATP-binding cassette domain-containing protein [Longimicrobiaceae bacterium]
MIRSRLLAPEVIQSSALDCGPAALKCLAEGFGIPVSYGRLREACQTDVDGTSIDSVEVVARHLGLDAEQVMLPADYLLLPEARALPAMVVVRNPGGATHFVVLWSARFGRVQVMDPAVGRRWLTARRLFADLYHHTLPVPAAAWRAWVASEEFAAVLRARLARLRSGPAGAELVECALGAEGWRPAARLDAALRLVEVLVGSRGVSRGASAERALRALVRATGERPGAEEEVIPAPYWMVRPLPPSPGGEDRLLLRGAVLVRVRGRLASTPDPAPGAAPSVEIRAALAEEPSRPGRELFRLVAREPAAVLLLLLAAAGASAAGVAAEAVLFRGLLETGRELGVPLQRVLLAGAVVLLSSTLLLLDLGIGSGTRRLGRHLEVGLRAALSAKLPRLEDRYFHSRLVSDMAERGHSLHSLRLFPDLVGRGVRTLGEILVATGIIVLISPASRVAAVVLAGLAVLVPWTLQRVVNERDLRLRSHQGALGRFYLDAMLGLAPIRAHGAERSVRREHESLAVEWAHAWSGLVRAMVGIDAAVWLAGYAVAAWIVLGGPARGVTGGDLLLLAYCALSVPALGQSLALLARQYAIQRSVAYRLFEPLSAPEPGADPPADPGGCPRDRPGVEIRMRGVRVEVAGHEILREIDLSVPPGAHVAVVGASGAGKSTLLGLLLGWHRPCAGEVRVDGALLSAGAVDRLRADTAWVDPAVWLWNRSLAENLRYGASPGGTHRVGEAVAAAELRGVVRHLPAGLQTSLGEGGGLISGGEGQRVRFGRALLRSRPRLVLLDEPFRGLDREQRRTLLARARAAWAGATLLCVTHDVGETGDFDLVLVMERGTLVEAGPPAEVAASPGSRYRALLDAEREVRERVWAGRAWRRLVVREGRVEEP